MTTFPADDPDKVPFAGILPAIVELHGGGWLRGSRREFTPLLTDAESFDLITGAGHFWRDAAPARVTELFARAIALVRRVTD